jgi:inactivated superfamily I helicase
MNLVYREKVNHLDHLHRHITAACMAVTTDNLNTARQRWVTRLHVCIRQDKQCTYTRGLRSYRARRRVADSRGPVLVAGLSLNK